MDAGPGKLGTGLGDNPPLDPTELARLARAPVAHYINGKFTAQRLTGVQRAAEHWVRAVDRLLVDAGGSSDRWVLLRPPASMSLDLKMVEQREVGPPGLPLHLWEQLILPWTARSGVLLNLCGASPWLGRRQICALHDAAVFDVPQAYGRAFRCWYRALFRHQAKRALRLLTVSTFSRRRLATALPCAPSRIAVVPNGGDHLQALESDAAALPRLGLSREAYFLVVGSASPAKNLARLWAALALLPNGASRWRLVVVGPSSPGVFARTTGRPPDGRVQWAGAVDDATLKALYEGALALVFPSLYEGFGLPPLEAMACGCPVIAARIEALLEVCGDAALYVDPQQPMALAEAMTRVAEDEGLRKRLSGAGRERARAWTWDEAGRRLLDAVGSAKRP